MRSARTSSAVLCSAPVHAATATTPPTTLRRPRYGLLLSVVVLVVLLQTVPGTHAHEALCHVCTDDVDTTETSLVCQTLTQTANLLTNLTYSEEICAGIQYRGVTAGCCDEPANFCHLCENKERLPNPDEKVSALTCAQIGGVASFVPSTGASCQVYQATYGVYCGCDNPIASANACRICGNDVPIEHRTLVSAPDFQTVAGAPSRRFCGALEFFSQFSTEPLPGCSAYQTRFGSSCCGGDGGEVATDDATTTDDSIDVPSGSGAANVTLAPVMAPTPLTTTTTTAPVAASAGNATKTDAPVATTTNVTAPVTARTPTDAPAAETPGTVPSPATTPTSATGTPPPPPPNTSTGWQTTVVWSTLLALVGGTMLIN